MSRPAWLRVAARADRVRLVGSTVLNELAVHSKPQSGLERLERLPKRERASTRTTSYGAGGLRGRLEEQGVAVRWCRTSRAPVERARGDVTPVPRQAVRARVSGGHTNCSRFQCVPPSRVGGPARVGTNTCTRRGSPQRASPGGAKTIKHGAPSATASPRSARTALHATTLQDRYVHAALCQDSAARALQDRYVHAVLDADPHQP